MQQDPPHHDSPWEALWLYVLTAGQGLLFVGWIAAWAGGFAPWVWWPALALALAGIGRGMYRRRAEVRRPSRFIWLVVAGGLVAAALYSRPGEYLRANWDPAVYLCTGLQLARTGSWTIEDDGGRHLAEAGLPDMARTARGARVKYPGFYVDPARPHTLQPQFYPLYSVSIGGLRILGGEGAAYRVNLFLMIAALVSLMLLARRAGGPVAAGLAGAALLLNPVQIWFSGFHTAEVLLQCQFLAVLLSWFAWWRAPSTGGALRTGFLCAGLWFTSVTGILLVVLAAGAHAAALPGSGRRTGWWLFGPIVGSLPLLAVQHLDMTTLYNRSIPRYLPVLETVPWLPVLLAGAALGGAGAVLLRRAGGRSRVPAGAARTGAAVAGALAGVGLTAFLYLGDFTEWRGYPLAAMLSRTGLVAAAAGGVVLVIRHGAAAFMLVAAPLLFTGLFAVEPMMSQVFPWGFKRYLAVTLPAACLLTGVFWGGVAGLAGARRWGQIAVVLLALSLLVRPLYRGRHFAFERDWVGLRQAMAQVEEALPPDALVLASRYWGPALDLVYGHRVIPIGWTDDGTWDDRSRHLLQNRAALDRPLVVVRDSGEPPPPLGAGPRLAEVAVKTTILDQDRRPFVTIIKDRRFTLIADALEPAKKVRGAGK